MKRVVTAAQVAHAPVIIGVDPAYSGVDDAVIYLRQGLHSKVLWTGNKTTDDLIMAKRIADFEDQYQADAVFIDFGYGTGLKSIGDGWGGRGNLFRSVARLLTRRCSTSVGRCSTHARHG